MKTKLWQIQRIAQEIFSSENAVIEYAESDSQYRELACALKMFDTLVVRQDRLKLDMEVGDEFVKGLLSKSHYNFFMSMGSCADSVTVRAYKSRDDDKTISAIEAFALIGGAALEEVFEFGSFTKK